MYEIKRHIKSEKELRKLKNIKNNVGIKMNSVRFKNKEMYYFLNRIFFISLIVIGLDMQHSLLTLIGFISLITSLLVGANDNIGIYIKFSNIIKNNKKLKIMKKRIIMLNEKIEKQKQECDFYSHLLYKDDVFKDLGKEELTEREVCFAKKHYYSYKENLYIKSNID